MKDQCCIDFSSRLLKAWRERMHKKIDYAKVSPSLPAFKRDERYWEGWNAGLNWAHRIVDGDKSAD